MSTRETNLPLFADLFRGEAIPGPRLAREECLPPRSRSKDPLSSHRAEAEVKRTGVMRGQRAIALDLVATYPGRTSKQLAELGTLDRYQLARRLPELEQMKLVERQEIGSHDATWWTRGRE